MVATVDRISPTDLTQLATDVGPVPMNAGALLVLAGAGPEEVRATLVSRLPRVDRFRQVLRTAPPGLGRPYWVADPAFDVGRHLTSATLSGPIDDARLATVAAQEVVRPFPPDRPLWRATVVSSGGDDGISGEPAGDDSVVGVVLVMHHVLADGLGALAVLLGLVDGAATGPVPRVSSGTAGVPAEPDRRTLLVGAWSERARAVKRLPATLSTLRLGQVELGAARPGRRARRPGTGSPVGQPAPRRHGAPACSINAPTGDRRAVHLTEVDLATLRVTAKARGATVNDCLLVAVTGALGDLLAARGEHPDFLVASVPVSARRSTTSRDLGNQVGVMAVPVELNGGVRERLALVAAETRIRKAARGSSATLIGPVFRGLAAVGAFRWLVDRQRLVNTFLTNLHGPGEPVHLAGALVTRIVPMTITAGNVGVAFAAMSYAGRLGVTVITDPDVVPEGAELAHALGAQLATIGG